MPEHSLGSNRAIIQDICDRVAIRALLKTKLRYMADLPDHRWSALENAMQYIGLPAVYVFLERDVKAVVRLFPEAARLREAKPDA